MKKATKILLIVLIISFALLAVACRWILTRPDYEHKVELLDNHEGVYHFAVFVNNRETPLNLNEREHEFVSLTIIIIDWQAEDGFSAFLYINDERTNNTNSHTFFLEDDISIQIRTLKNEENPPPTYFDIIFDLLYAEGWDVEEAPMEYIEEDFGSMVTRAFDAIYDYEEFFVLLEFEDEVDETLKTLIIFIFTIGLEYYYYYFGIDELFVGVHENILFVGTYDIANRVNELLGGENDLIRIYFEEDEILTCDYCQNPLDYCTCDYCDYCEYEIEYCICCPNPDCDYLDCEECEQCEICQTWNCEKTHIQCQICNTWNCKVTHVPCENPTCPNYDCITCIPCVNTACQNFNCTTCIPCLNSDCPNFNCTICEQCLICGVWNCSITHDPCINIDCPNYDCTTCIPCVNTACPNFNCTTCIPCINNECPNFNCTTCVPCPNSDCPDFNCTTCEQCLICGVWNCSATHIPCENPACQNHDCTTCVPCINAVCPNFNCTACVPCPNSDCPDFNCTTCEQCLICGVWNCSITHDPCINIDCPNYDCTTCIPCINNECPIFNCTTCIPCSNSDCSNFNCTICEQCEYCNAWNCPLHLPCGVCEAYPCECAWIVNVGGLVQNRLFNLYSRNDNEPLGGVAVSVLKANDIVIIVVLEQNFMFNVDNNHISLGRNLFNALGYLSYAVVSVIFLPSDFSLEIVIATTVGQNIYLFAYPHTPGPCGFYPCICHENEISPAYPCGNDPCTCDGTRIVLETPSDLRRGSGQFGDVGVNYISWNSVKNATIYRVYFFIVGSSEWSLREEVSLPQLGGVFNFLLSMAGTHYIRVQAISNLWGFEMSGFAYMRVVVSVGEDYYENEYNYISDIEITFDTPDISQMLPTLDLEAPYNLRRGEGTQNAALIWEAVPNAEFYRVYILFDNSFSWQFFTQTISTQLSVFFGGGGVFASREGIHFVRVQAINLEEILASEFSYLKVVTGSFGMIISTESVDDVTIPEPPKPNNLSVPTNIKMGDGINSHALIWDSCENADFFRVYVRLHGTARWILHEYQPTVSRINLFFQRGNSDLINNMSDNSGTHLLRIRAMSKTQGHLPSNFAYALVFSSIGTITLVSYLG
ncbi:MAG: hypothetical protein FWE22_02160 [Firmicutes bacterium]|nr:hypothetical protein [Bacillota bacterium]